jgi:hypothetical protein
MKIFYFTIHTGDSKNLLQFCLLNKIYACNVQDAFQFLHKVALQNLSGQEFR